MKIGRQLFDIHGVATVLLNAVAEGMKRLFPRIDNMLNNLGAARRSPMKCEKCTEQKYADFQLKYKKI
jgi:hypothetical protein